MEYASQFGLMRQKAAEEKLSFAKVLDYYRERLQALHTAGPDMNPYVQQFRAECQTWNSFWPEQPFEGIEPMRLPYALMAKEASSTGTPSISGELHSLSDMRDVTDAYPPSTPAVSSPGAPRASQLSYPQVSASGKPVFHKNMAKTQQQSIFDAAQMPLVQRTCGACKQKGHILADCTRKVDKFGFLCGCPRCNTTKHGFDNCVGHPNGKKKRKPTTSTYWYFLVMKRLGKAPLRSRMDFRLVNPEKWATLNKLHPQTCQFAATRQLYKIEQKIDELVEDPSWANPNSIGSQIHPFEVESHQASPNLSTESTVAESAVSLQSAPGPQSSPLITTTGSDSPGAVTIIKAEPEAVDALLQRGFGAPGTSTPAYEPRASRHNPSINERTRSAPEEGYYPIPPSVPQFPGISQQASPNSLRNDHDPSTAP